MSVRAMQWILSDDTGLSSTAIWAHMMGQAPPRSAWGSKADYPHDPDDFGRCYRLMLLIPAWRGRIGEMAEYGGPWARLAPAWDELEELWEQEIGVGMSRDWPRGTSAPKLYARMRELIDAKATVPNAAPPPVPPPGR